MSLDKYKSCYFHSPVLTKFSASPLQKTFSVPKPPKQLHKIKHGFQTNDGVNADKIYSRFFERESTKTIDIHRDSIHRENECEKYSELPAIGTTKNFNIKRRSVDEKDTYHHVMSTDYISMSPKFEKKPFQKVFDNAMLSLPTTINKETIVNEWPKVKEVEKFYNRSSVDYNIINADPNAYSGYEPIKFEDAKIAHKVKGMSEIIDEFDPGRLRHNTILLDLHKKNPQMFKKKIGIFTGLYDTSFKYGHLHIPFK